MYVGITRAKKKLYLSCARMRMLHGETVFNPVSRFLTEIPDGMTGLSRQVEKRRLPFRDFDGESGSFGGFGSGSYGGSGSIGGSRSGFRESPAPSVRPASKERPKPPAPSFGKTFEVQKAASLEYDVGDRVVHRLFGEGTVTEITEGKKDYEVSVRFDTAGEKRMFASFAKLKKI